MKVWAISDLHLGHQANRDALAALPSFGRDWVILGGDVGESEEHLELALTSFSRRFARVLWVPGNHELWTVKSRDRTEPRGQAKYDRLVALCRRHGALTPEDPYPLWLGEGGPHLIAPLFALYDYSFRPAEVPAEGAVAWAEETGLLCTDEVMLHPEPHASTPAWCAARCALTERRLGELDPRVSRCTNAARRARQPGKNAVHGKAAEFGVRNVHQGLALLDVGVLPKSGSTSCRLSK